MWWHCEENGDNVNAIADKYGENYDNFNENCDKFGPNGDNLLTLMKFLNIYDEYLPLIA